MTAQQTGPGKGVSRDRWGRPLITPPEGGKAVPYVRVTTLAGTLEDTYNLGKWQQRQVAMGIAARPDLVALVSAARGDKGALDAVCEQAHEAAASSAAANTGTAIHGLAEHLDTGLTNLAGIPAEYRPDLAAYLEHTAGWRHLHVERFMVCDDLRVAGTPDRISVLPDGRCVIADLKTGSVDYGMGKIALQLAIYSRSVFYDVETGQRTPLEVDQDTAIVIHVPAGQGTARLLEVDLNAGWEAVELATKVRAWRTRKDLAREWVNPVAGMRDVVAEPVTPPAPVVAANSQDEIRAAKVSAAMTEIANADSVEILTGIYHEHIALWTNELTAAAAERKRQLLGGAT